MAKLTSKTHVSHILEITDEEAEVIETLLFSVHLGMSGRYANSVAELLEALENRDNQTVDDRYLEIGNAKDKAGALSPLLALWSDEDPDPRPKATVKKTAVKKK